jgi:MHS family proline/betaine transporter-like MFS transporter
MPTVTRPAPTWATVGAASIGNALEWFDLTIYAYLAVTISKLFFPSSSDAVSLLLSFGTFGASYLIRPLGAIVLGAYGDRAGRKASMTMSIALMMVGTLIMAVVPTYDSIGLAAPALVILARLMQGFSVGGEFGSATSFLVEHGRDRRGFFASFQWAGQGLAAVLSSAFGVALVSLLTDAQLSSWGWRLPYVFGLLIGPVGYYIRTRVEESPDFVAAGRDSAPLRTLFRDNLGSVGMAIAITAISTSANYLILYMPTFAVKSLHLPQVIGFIATLSGGLILTFGAPVAGHISDRVGRARMLIVASVLFLVTGYPAFWLLTAFPSLPVIVAIVCWLSFLKTIYSGVLPSAMAELFPVATRSTGMALGYNIGVPVFGGFAPFLATSLIALTGDVRSPAYYLMGTAVLSLAALSSMGGRGRR